MKTRHLSAIPALALLLSAYSCIDNNYDLSDVDSLARIPVKDLVIPINIDEIYLKSIIDIDENDPDEDIVNIGGSYAMVKSGDFNTKIHINEVTVAKPTVNPLQVSVPMPKELQNITVPAVKFDVPIPSESTTFSFTANDITPDICDVNFIGGDMSIGLDIDFIGIADFVSTLDVNLQIQLPQRLSIVSEDNYDPQTGILTINRDNCPDRLTINLQANGINTSECFDPNNHSLTIDGAVAIVGGQLSIATPGSTKVPAQIGIKVAPSFSNMVANTFTGVLQHAVDNIDVPDINITDLPDVLSQPGTNLLLQNPYLFISFTNPLNPYHLGAQSGFDITAYHGSSSKVYSIDNPYFDITPEPRNIFCFSPKSPAQGGEQFVSDEYRQYVHVPYSSLSNVLSGDGIPERLVVDLPDFNIYRQSVNGFELGRDFVIDGAYRFVAPLQLAAGSSIIYSDTKNGWADEDLDAITIERLEINLTISTDIPLGVKFTGYPIDVNGNRINNVEILGADINPMADNQDVKIKISGAITKLDGIEFEAKVNATDGAPLGPDMHIVLKNVRPCISGYYEKEL